MSRIDLRSDTVTQPTAAMRRAIADAAVGDDVYGEDPTVTALERRVAELVGKEQALFVPSGTMANQIAIWMQTRRGDEVIVGEGAHCRLFESGAAAALSGVQFATAGSGGLFDAPDAEAQIKPNAYYLPRSSLIALENTHNRAGGRIFPQPAVERIAELARKHALGLHLDGARIWNASVATGLAPDALAAPFDTVSVCFSKGLGAPVGSALCSSAERIGEARRLRRMLGGAMRQAGLLAAAALHALEHHRSRLADDHENARFLAARLASVGGAEVALERVETNIVNIYLPSADPDAVIRRATEQGVFCATIAARTIRLVTHLNVSRTEVERAAEVLTRAIEAESGARPA